MTSKLINTDTNIDTIFNYKVSTITMTVQLNECQLNLNNIGKYLSIDDNILGIKYHSGNSSIIKGKYLTAIYNKSKNKNENKINKRLFYNQVSLIINHIGKDGENNVNVKIFGNGSLHLTGVKNISEGKEIFSMLYNEKIKKLKDYSSLILLTKDTNGIYLDSNNNIYSMFTKVYIGYKLNKFIYIINKKEYYITEINNQKKFISNKLEAKRTRSILNMDGKYIGFSKINLIRNKSKLYKNNSNIHFDKNFIFYDGNGSSTIIGHISYEITSDTLEEEEDTQEDFIEYNYNCNPYKIEPTEFKINTNVNTINIYFKLDFELNRQRLFDKLLQLNYIIEYAPEKYSGVKLTYKLNQNYLNNGICLCNNKCTCNNITFLIFQSGNIIVTGFKDVDHISHVLNSFKNIISMFIDHIIKRVFN